jgi:hypothetical protein
MKKKSTKEETNNIFITGADKKCEWLLPWWYRNYSANNNIPIIIADFGLSSQGLDWCEKNNLEVQKVEGSKGWHMKPSALSQINKGEKRVWIDVDCQVLKKIDNIFDYVVEDKLTCSEDTYHSWGCKWQTGVVGVMGNPEILKEWEEKCLNPSGPYARGDQELLWELIKEKGKGYINRLPQNFNWLRMALHYGHRHKDMRIVHWTGEKGKKIIISSIRNKKPTFKFCDGPGWTQKTNNPTSGYGGIDNPTNNQKIS